MSNTLLNTRRQFLATSTAFASFLAMGCAVRDTRTAARDFSYGPLRRDPEGLFDLPAGFSYRVISRQGDAMTDGGKVPNNADGMGCFALPGDRLALVRNHELTATGDAGGTPPGYDYRDNGLVLPGGTTTLVLDAKTLAVQKQFRSLAGTIRNCAGGITPWGSWLTCEEDTTRAGSRGVGKDHGYIFEVPAAAEGPVDPVPLKDMGRFYHEAACVDPVTGMVYETEDREDGLLYRFVPRTPGKLAQGGQLQALVIDGLPDSRNRDKQAFAPGSSQKVRWVDLEDPENPAEDLRKRGAAKGATLFARGEGIFMGKDELYFCCTNGGTAKLGQIFRLRPRSNELQLFYESVSLEQFNFGDNLIVAPNGHLIACEDQYTRNVDNHLRGVTPAGVAYPLARLHRQTELAGACFSLMARCCSSTCTVPR